MRRRAHLKLSRIPFHAIVLGAEPNAPKMLRLLSLDPCSNLASVTGRAFTRVGMYPGVLSPVSIGGLGLNETTLASALRSKGFTTGMVGKWQ